MIGGIVTGNRNLNTHLTKETRHFPTYKIDIIQLVFDVIFAIVSLSKPSVFFVISGEVGGVGK